MTLDNIIASRYSCRNYSDYVPTADEMGALLEAARLAPSACNRQPWRFMVIGPDDADGRKAVADAYAREWVQTAQTYIIVFGTPDKAWVRPFDGVNHTAIDIAITTEHICLKATEIGLATCWICNFDPAVLSAALGVGEELVPMVILPVGKPVDAAVPEKKRLDLSELVIKR